MDNFTPIASTLGGVLIGLAAAGLMLFNGRIAGISSVIGDLLERKTTERSWRLSFVAGLLAGGMGLYAFVPHVFTNTLVLPLWAMALAGFLTGVGTRMGNGCTSGHGVCGLPRFSKRSLASVLVFMGTGAIAAWVSLNWVQGGAA